MGKAGTCGPVTSLTTTSTRWGTCCSHAGWSCVGERKEIERAGLSFSAPFLDFMASRIVDRHVAALAGCDTIHDRLSPIQPSTSIYSPIRNGRAKPTAGL